MALDKDARRLGSSGTGTHHTYMWPLQYGSLRLMAPLHASLGHPEGFPRQQMQKLPMTSPGSPRKLLLLDSIG